jgi:uncharacterized membrane protein YozB (DUF420 family)
MILKSFLFCSFLKNQLHKVTSIKPQVPRQKIYPQKWIILRIFQTLFFVFLLFALFDIKKKERKKGEG